MTQAFAVVSDIHANLEAWQAFLEYCEQHRIEHIYILGDLVGYGPNPAEVVQSIQQLSIAGKATVIGGNHDDGACKEKGRRWLDSLGIISSVWTHEELQRHDVSQDTNLLGFLADLKYYTIIKHFPVSMLLVHGKADKHRRVSLSDRVISSAAATQHMSNIGKQFSVCPISFFGHTHLRTALWGKIEKTWLGLGRNIIFQGDIFKSPVLNTIRIDSDNRILNGSVLYDIKHNSDLAISLNPDSLGKQRWGNMQDARFIHATFDGQSFNFKFVSIEYDYSSFLAALERQCKRLSNYYKLRQTYIEKDKKLSPSTRRTASRKACAKRYKERVKRLKRKR